jgi:hypothetical protein
VSWHAYAIFGAMMLTCGLCGALGAALAFKWFTRGGVTFAVKRCTVYLNGEVALPTDPQSPEQPHGEKA